MQSRLRRLRQDRLPEGSAAAAHERVADALAAVDECGAPIVSIAGGEPLIHRELPQIVAGIVARRKFVYLCTNAILLTRHIDE